MVRVREGETGMGELCNASACSTHSDSGNRNHQSFGSFELYDKSYSPHRLITSQAALKEAEVAEDLTLLKGKILLEVQIQALSRTSSRLFPLVVKWSSNRYRNSLGTLAWC